MFQIPMTQPDPALHMRRYHLGNVATKENKWQGPNFPRYVNKDYDAAIAAAETEIDPVKRAALYIKCNDLLWQDTVFIPVMHRLTVDACANTLKPVISGWANGPTTSRTGTGRHDRAGARRDRPCMSQYVLRRLLIAIPSLLGICLVLFMVLALAPGDPFAELATNPNVPPEVHAACGPSSASTIRSSALPALAVAMAARRLGLLLCQPRRTSTRSSCSACRRRST